MKRLLMLAAAGLFITGCASPNVNPPQARAKTGYVDFYADSSGELSWQVARFDARTQGFRSVFSEFEPPPGRVLRLAFPPGHYRLRVTFMNCVVREPGLVEVEVKDGLITPVHVPLIHDGTAPWRPKKPALAAPSKAGMAAAPNSAAMSPPCTGFRPRRNPPALRGKGTDALCALNSETWRVAVAGGKCPASSPLAPVPRHWSLATCHWPLVTLASCSSPWARAAASCRGPWIFRARPSAPSRRARRTRHIVDPVEVQQTLLRFADEYSMRMIGGVDNLRRGTNALTRAEALEAKIAIGTETWSIASGPNAVADLLDMTVFVTVTRMALEEHWQPKVFGESAQPMLEYSRSAETEIWRLAGTVLTPQQQAELRAGD